MQKFFALLTAAWVFLWLACGTARADTISFTGNIRSDATFTGCGSASNLGPRNSDGDYAQWAAVVRSFHLSAASKVEAITFSYGGGTNGAGQVILQGGFEPYLSLFDASDNCSELD